MKKKPSGVKRADELGLRLIKASNQANFGKFKRIIHEALEEFSDAEEHIWYRFFNVRDNAGWNILTHTGAGGQHEYLDLLFSTLHKVFKKNIDDYISLMVANTDFEGRTPLHMTISRRHFKIALALLDMIMMHATSKPSCFFVVNMTNNHRGFTPLMTAVYRSYKSDLEGFTFIKLFLKKVVNYLESDSRMFWLFINMRDYNGWTPLAYAADDKLVTLLKSYGAIDRPPEPIKNLLNFDALIHEDEIKLKYAHKEKLNRQEFVEEIHDLLR